MRKRQRAQLSLFGNIVIAPSTLKGLTVWRSTLPYATRTASSRLPHALRQRPPMARTRRIARTFLGPLTAAMLLAGCASTTDDANDPLETLNRHVFAVNQAVDVLILRPVAVTYRDWMPEQIKVAVNNFLNYLKSPVILANDVLQGDWQRAGQTLERFAQNSLTLGLADVAAPRIPFHDEDFGQTLATWGSGEGFYLVLPLLGPSNPRDAVGTVVDWFIDPVYWIATNNQWDGLTYGRTAARVVTARVDTLAITDDLERTSLDYYATIRSLYRQRRADEIRNRAPAPRALAPSADQAEIVDISAPVAN
jgi:phospholipid-binding lipoprotein MlaA